MALTQPLNGFNGKLTIDLLDNGTDVTVAGISGLNIGADERNILDIPTTFDTDRDQSIIQQKGVISWNIEGFYLLGIDDGQDFLKTYYDSQAEIASGIMKFWLDETNYITAAVGDHMKVSGLGEISTSPEGFATFSASGLFFNDYVALTDPT